MSEMLERVAGAIVAAGYNPATAAAIARIAIAEMREPTQTMWLTKDQPVWALGRPMWDWWRAMIDAALE